MRSSFAVLAAASTAMALPLVDSVVNKATTLVAALPVGQVTDGVTDGVTQTVATADGLVDGTLETVAVEDTVHLVWTYAKVDDIVSLSILDGLAEKIVATTCADKIATGVFKKLPVDFSQLNPEGVGNFVFNDTEYNVDQALKGAFDTVNCVRSSVTDFTVVDCVVPKVTGLVLPVVNDVVNAATCIVSGLPLVSELPALAALGL